MAYQALYRKWRPRTFDSVVGQKAITDTLKNAVLRQTVSHAYLFAGPRGTGKTSCAKILAKALNCLNLQEGEPCNHCENCLAADRGSMPDIMEIDAASNNGVDEIRSIRDKVKYAPTQGKYKVYIIDEVHMLSMGAFNALLKTLEEPPAHVVFILATTELQKVPATIISRTQKYSFKRIDRQDLISRMEYILKQEKIAFEPEALDIISRVADGGMRDALSILDQLLSYEKGKISYQDALEITGYADQKKVEALFLAALTAKTTTALQLAKELLDSGASVQRILAEIINLATQSLLVVKSKTTNNNFLTDDFLAKIAAIAPSRFFSLVEQANQALLELRYTDQQQIPLEVFLIKAAQANSVPDDLTKQVQKLQQEVSQLQQALNQQPAAPKKITTPAAPAKKAARPQPELNRERVYQVLGQATKQDLQAIKDVWPDLRSVLEVSQRALLEVLEPVAASPQAVVMKCQYAFWFEKASSDSDLLTELTNDLAKFTKHDYQIVLVPAQDWLEVRSDFLKQHKAEFWEKKKTAPAEEEQQKEAAQKIISKAKDLFGDTVKVKDK